MDVKLRKLRRATPFLNFATCPAMRRGDDKRATAL